MEKLVNKEDLITVIGANFISFVIWDLIEESYLTYIKTDFTKKRFQTAMWEHSHAAAAIVLTVIGIEAYRNRIFVLKNIKINRRNVPDDICKILQKGNANFPIDTLNELLTEVFVVRDVITHNHIYKVKISSDEKWNVIQCRQKLLEGYGDLKYENHVNIRTKKTKLLKLNVQPAKIGFEDVFTVLVVTDLLINLIQMVLGAGYAPLHIDTKIANHNASNISQVLTHYYLQIKRKVFLEFIDRLARQLREEFTPFLTPYVISDCFIKNICPVCSKLGFDRFDNEYYCEKCGVNFGINEDGVNIVEFAKKNKNVG